MKKSGVKKSGNINPFLKKPVYEKSGNEKVRNYKILLMLCYLIYSLLYALYTIVKFCIDVMISYNINMLNFEFIFSIEKSFNCLVYNDRTF